MSNILPKKSWHIYNDKNKEKVRRDESAARIEKERSEERAKAAEREHRLSLLRSKANVKLSEPSEPLEPSERETVQKQTKRFELFDPEEGKFAVEEEKSQKYTNSKAKHEDYRKRNRGESRTSNDNIEAGHFRDDPLLSTNKRTTSKKSYGGKDYSFV